MLICLYEGYEDKEKGAESLLSADTRYDMRRSLNTIYAGVRRTMYITIELHKGTPGDKKASSGTGILAGRQALQTTYTYVKGMYSI